ncbi:MAG: LacI family DNA-binding transcriptional regulator [Chloroflexi bacterium OHK40]
MTVRLQDIADRLQLSRATVSLALRDSPQIGEETRARVREAAAELGYLVRVRGVSPTGLRHITFCTPYASSNNFHADILRAAEAECRELGIALHFVQLAEGFSPRDLNQFGEQHGILLVGSIDEGMVRQVKQLGRPVVLVDNNLPHLGLDRVLTENIGAMQQAVAHLVELGHRRIAFLCGPDGHPSFEERLLGYQRAIARAGLTPVVIGPDPTHGARDGEQNFARMLEAGERLDATALIVFNDEAAAGVIHRLQDRGYRIPEDLSVVGFDDVNVATIIRPNLTTCAVSREQLGRWSVRCLRNRALNPTAVTQALSFDTTLVVRHSTAPPAA